VLEDAKLNVELNKEVGLRSKILEEVVKGDDETTAGDIVLNEPQLEGDEKSGAGANGFGELNCGVQGPATLSSHRNSSWLLPR
jgi:hypothetical protein